VSVGLLLGGIGLASPIVSAGTADPNGGTGSYVLTATEQGSTYAPTFTGNGELGVRVPADGQGSASGAVPTPSELAGFYAGPAGEVQQRANIPTWSTLIFSDGGQPFDSGGGQTSQWRQSIDLKTGIITTRALWRSSSGHMTELTYEVLTDRSRPHVGLVRLTLTPRWSGPATVTDSIDGSSANLSTQVGKGWSPSSRSDWVEVKAVGTGITASIASRIGTSEDVEPKTAPIDQATDRSVGQRLTFPVSAGRTYSIVKYVGVDSSLDTSAPTVAAQRQADSAGSSGFGALVAANDTAWATLWSGRIDVLGNPVLASDVNASEFYLWSSTRDGVDWSISPAGLSSNGYSGHIFWDADTWMDPALLAQHPDLAAAMNAYRFKRLPAAEAHATSTGYQGARYPWESAVSGTEQIPPPASLFTEGLYEQHVTADIALAQWQYYLATGDKVWLTRYGWPVLSQAAAFWVSRVTPALDGSYHIEGVTGPDEENADVDDEAYTNAAAKMILGDATDAARVLGTHAPASWAHISSHLVVPEDPATGIVPEFAGYNGGLVKQADVTMLQYPWDYSLPAGVAQDDINYYVPRTDPSGPSMSDAIDSIGTSAIGTPGCASFVFTQRSVQPYIRDSFDQFSETKTGGAFTFMTGIGGFLQEFLYGYSGLRFHSNAVEVSPLLTGQIGGIVLHDLSWHGRRFTIAIGPKTTSVTPVSGATVPVTTSSGPHEVGPGQTLTLPTRRPDLTAATDAVRCGSVSASSSQPGAPALAAVDGSPATGWQPLSVPATLSVPVAHGPRPISTVTIQWAQQWPEPPIPDQSPPAGPVNTLRATDYVVSTSLDGHSWHPVAEVAGRVTGMTDVLTFVPVKARFIALHITASANGMTPKLDELSAS
jgi:trehalose/maltose hydrolase-like predicted phosphorylase